MRTMTYFTRQAIHIIKKHSYKHVLFNTQAENTYYLHLMNLESWFMMSKQPTRTTPTLVSSLTVNATK